MIPLREEDDLIKDLVFITTEYCNSDLLAGLVWVDVKDKDVYTVKNSVGAFEELAKKIEDNVQYAEPIYILGENLAISYDLDQLLKEKGYIEVTRIGGIDQYETAEKILMCFYDDDISSVLLVDATKIDQYTVETLYELSENRMPILYTNGNQLPEFTIKALLNVQPSEVYVMEGTSTKLIEEINKVLENETKVLTITSNIEVEILNN